MGRQNNRREDLTVRYQLAVADGDRDLALKLRDTVMQEYKTWKRILNAWDKWEEAFINKKAEALRTAKRLVSVGDVVRFRYDPDGLGAVTVKGEILLADDHDEILVTLPPSYKRGTDRIHLKDIVEVTGESHGDISGVADLSVTVDSYVCWTTEHGATRLSQVAAIWKSEGLRDPEGKKIASEMKPTDRIPAGDVGQKDKANDYMVRFDNPDGSATFVTNAGLIPNLPAPDVPAKTDTRTPKDLWLGATVRCCRHTDTVGDHRGHKFKGTVEMIYDVTQACQVDAINLELVGRTWRDGGNLFNLTVKKDNGACVDIYNADITEVIDPFPPRPGKGGDVKADDDTTPDTPKEALVKIGTVVTAVAGESADGCRLVRRGKIVKIIQPILCGQEEERQAVGLQRFLARAYEIDVEFPDGTTVGLSNHDVVQAYRWVTDGSGNTLLHVGDRVELAGNYPDPVKVAGIQATMDNGTTWVSKDVVNMSWVLDPGATCRVRLQVTGEDISQVVSGIYVKAILL